MTSFKSLIREGDKLWYLDQQVQVVLIDDQEVTVKFLNDGREETTNILHLETRQHPPGAEHEKPGWLSAVKSDND